MGINNSSPPFPVEKVTIEYWEDCADIIEGPELKRLWTMIRLLVWSVKQGGSESEEKIS